MSVRAVRGTRDLLPEETPAWQFLEDQARQVAHQYGYQEIRTPLFEKAELFVRGMGVLAGLVERELWTFHDKFGQKLALRADVTASVVRAFYEHNLADRQPGVKKLYYLSPVFLIGRENDEGSRQCHQFGVEALGSADPALDAEVLALAWAYCKKLGLEDVMFELNSLGCDKCRPAYHEALKEYFAAKSNELCTTCKRKHKTHPLWTLGCQERSCVELSQVAPTMFGVLCPACKTHFNQLKTYLSELKIPHDLNPRVVRDLEYYNRTIFQVLCRGQVIATGGRYDGLVETLGGPSTPAVGFAMHLENLLEEVRDTPGPPGPLVFLQPEGGEATRLLIPVLNRLREAGICAEMNYTADVGEEAVPPPARWVVSLSDKDAARGQIQLLDRKTDQKDRLSVGDVAHRIAAKLGMVGSLQPVERPVPEGREGREPREGRARPGSRRNGALRGRHFNVESDLEVHYDQQEPAPAVPAADAARSKRRRRRRRGGEAEPILEVARIQDEPVQAAGVEAEDSTGSGRSRRSRRSRRDAGTERVQTAASRPPAPPEYDERYERERSRRPDYDYEPSYEYQAPTRDPDSDWERESRRDYPPATYREPRYRDKHEPSVETRYYDDYQAPAGARSEYPEDYPREAPPARAASSGRGRSRARGREDSYEAPPPPARSAQDYDEYDDGPQPVDSKLALLESSRAASRSYRPSGDSEGGSRSRQRRPSAQSSSSSARSSSSGSRHRRSAPRRPAQESGS